MLKFSPTLIALTLVVAMGGNVFAKGVEDSVHGKEEVKDTTEALKEGGKLSSDAHASSSDNVVKGAFGSKNTIPSDILSNPHVDKNNAETVATINRLVSKVGDKNGVALKFYRDVLAGMRSKPVTEKSKSSAAQLALVLDAAPSREIIAHASPSNVQGMIDFIAEYEGAAEANFNWTLFYTAKAFLGNQNLSMIDALAQGMEDYLVDKAHQDRADARKTADDVVRKNHCMGFADAA